MTMKNYIITSLLLASTLTTVAQELSVKAMVIYKTDGTKDTIMYPMGDDPSWITGENTFYGKENPEDDDYITCNFDYSINYEDMYLSKLFCTYQLTPLVSNAPVGHCRCLLSSSPIPSEPQDYMLYYGYHSYTLLFLDTTFNSGYPVTYGSYISNNSTEAFLFGEKNDRYNRKLVPGTTYYGKAYCPLDGKIYFSKETSFRVPKTRKIVKGLQYSDYIFANDSVVFILGDVDFSQGDSTAVSKQITSQYLVQTINALPKEDMLAMVTKTEECDDGTLYVIDSINEDVINLAHNIMENDAKQEFFVEASLDNVLTGNSTTTTTFGSYGCTPTCITFSNTIGIQDNKAFYTGKPLTTGSSPRLCVNINHIMLPGQEYEIKFTFLPKRLYIYDYPDSLARPTYFRVYVADGKGDSMYGDSFPLLQNANVYGNDTVIGNSCFAASATEPYEITIRYTPTRLTYCHALQLRHAVAFSTAANRERYSQDLCISGIYIKPVKQ